MTPVNEPALMLLPLSVGWGAWRWYRRYPTRGNPLAVIGLWAYVVPGGFLVALATLGLRWHVWLMWVMAGAGLLVGLLARRRVPAASQTARTWAVVAGVILGFQALQMALRPVTGWDFRYMWGLKAKVFALAGTNDPRWLAWLPNAMLHPDYPPLWPDVMAMGVRSGGSVEAVATAWQVLLLIALGAGCWDNLRDAPPVIRTLGAAAGGFAPIILMPVYSGYADLAVAFLAAVALGSLARMRKSKAADAATLLSLSGAVAGLCLTKNEGMVLAFGVMLAVMWFGTKRDRIAVAATFLVAVSSWQAFLFVHGVPPEPRSLNPHAWLVAAREAARWMWGQGFVPLGLLLVIWLLALIALARKETTPVVIALGVYACGVAAAYLSSLQGTVWHLATSLDRVAATPLPAVLSLALARNTSA